jgi:hypothetical protein
MNIQTSTQNSQDTLARLLATENITVIRGNVSTASFDILNRRLLLPRWKEMTPVIEEMLMLHEVGHALFTTQEKYGIVFSEKKYLKDYANVIEDVRIERKMKERYPGSRKSFNNGYRELNERDFFGVTRQNLDTLLLIDKINLYFKVGFNCGVKFSPIEYAFIRKADLCKTEDDVVDLAQEIFDFSKGQKQDQLNNRIPLQFEPELRSEDDNEYDEGDDMDDDEESSMYDNYADDIDSEEAEEPKKQNQRGSGSYKEPEHEQEKEVKDEDLAPSTYKTFNDKVDQLADESLRIEYFECAFEHKYNRKIIVPYKTCLEGLTRGMTDSRKNRAQKFKGTNNQVVSYLVKEFEMKKSATAYKRAKIAKLGQLDSNKLYAYKLKDDLFKQIMQVKDGKKHGMIFMLDWSGSMQDYIDETIEQVINLAMFCQRIQIPYQVFAFADGYGETDANVYDDRTHNPKGIANNISFNLLELFSHKMTNVEFNRMLECMLNRPYISDRFGLNGTPLNEALLFMTDYIGEFIKVNQVEKMTFITLTDGEGGQLYSQTNRITNGASYDSITGKRIKVKSYMRDQITKKDYELESNSASQTAMLLDIIRNRYDINSVAFFLMRPTHSNAQAFIKNNFGEMNNNLLISLLDKISTDMRKQKYCILNNVPGRDEFYLLDAKVKIEDEDLKADDTMSSSQLSRALGKVFNTKKTSRVVLNRFVEMVA